jgi:stress response protein YsnF
MTEFPSDPPLDGPDSGEIITLPDGSVSIPVFEEVLVVEKRRRVRERIIVRKETVVEDYVVEADLRKERVSVEADDDVADRVTDGVS